MLLSKCPGRAGLEIIFKISRRTGILESNESNEFPRQRISGGHYYRASQPLCDAAAQFVIYRAHPRPALGDPHRQQPRRLARRAQQPPRETPQPVEMEGGEWVKRSTLSVER